MATCSSAHFKNECLRSADLGGDLKAAAFSANARRTVYGTVCTGSTLGCKAQQQERAATIKAFKGENRANPDEVKSVSSLSLRHSATNSTT